MRIFLYHSPGPTEPRNVHLQTDTDTGRATILYWVEPQEVCGILLHYLIIIASVNDSTAATIVYQVELVHGTTNYSVNLDDIDGAGLTSGNYYIWVKQ